MIYECTTALQAKFKARKFPTVFEYGARRMLVEAWHDHLVIVERDSDTPDAPAPVNGQQTNPRRLCNIALAAKATIYARCNLDNARLNEHQHECEQIRDAFICALSEWGSEARARLGDVTPTLGEMRYLRLTEFPEAETWPGVVYLVRFKVMRGVVVRDYEGAARPTGAAAGVSNRIDIRQNGVEPPEVVTLP